MGKWLQAPSRHIEASKQPIRRECTAFLVSHCLWVATDTPSVLFCKAERRVPVELQIYISLFWRKKIGE